MAFEMREGGGNLFKNDLKDSGSQQPDYRGSIMLGGVVYEIAGWKKEGKKGTFLSLKGQLPREKDAKGPREGDRIPF
jgi:hypothetical protein